MLLAGCSDEPIWVNRTPMLQEQIRPGDAEFCKDTANKYTNRCSDFGFRLKLEARRDAARRLGLRR